MILQFELFTLVLYITVVEWHVKAVRFLFKKITHFFKAFNKPKNFAIDIINCIIFFTNRLRAIFCYLCSFISFWITSITCSSLSKNSITKYSSGISIPKYSSIYRLGPHNNQKALILFIRVTLLHLFLIFVLYVLFDVV